MNKDFWLEAWRSGRTRFHKSETNRLLIDHINIFESLETIFVPLCGKSVDMIYLLSLNKKVIGVELSELAVESFFKENELSYIKEESQRYKKYTSNHLTLFCGNLFDLNKDELGEVRALYDRASLVALPPDMRKEYANFIKRNCPKLEKMLLGSFEYDQTKADGPPFSVDQTEIQILYGDKFNVSQIETEETEDRNPRFENKGLESFCQTSYLIEAKLYS